MKTTTIYGKATTELPGQGIIDRTDDLVNFSLTQITKSQKQLLPL